MHSGDVGTILPNGALQIIDRKKNIYKLSQGEYIAPQKIENIYKRSNLIAEIYLYGDSLSHYNVAIATPDKEELLKFVKNHSEELGKKSFEEMCNDPEVNKLVTEQLNERVRKQGLQGYETAKKIKFIPKSFATYGLLTQTMKVQRHIAKKMFDQEIAEMYKK